MSRVYVLGSIHGQGKTTTSVALAKYFTSQGEKVACMQMMKGQYDVGHYLKEGCYHYSLPLEALKSKETIAEWLPAGYDVHILEVTYPYSPIGASYVTLFDNINEIIGHENWENWDEYVKGNVLRWFKCSKILKLWDMVHERTIQQVITKTDGDIGQPCVDTGRVLHHVEEFIYDEIEPRMTLPRSDKKVLAVGAFPAEFWDIYPDLEWHGYDYSAFTDDLKMNSYDFAIVGACMDENLKLDVSSTEKPVYCYQPSTLSDRMAIDIHSAGKSTINPLVVLDRIRNQPVGTNFWGSDLSYSGYNNRLWIFRGYSGEDILEKEGNILYCNGWILPQHLMREGLLEV